MYTTHAPAASIYFGPKAPFFSSISCSSCSSSWSIFMPLLVGVSNLFSPALGLPWSGSFSRFSSRASLLAMLRSSLGSLALWELGWPSLYRSRSSTSDCLGLR